MELLHSTLGRGWRVAVISGIAHSHTVTAFVPQSSQAKHAFLATGTVPIYRTTLTQFLNEALAYITRTQSLVACTGAGDPTEEYCSNYEYCNVTGLLHLSQVELSVPGTAKLLPLQSRGASFFLGFFVCVLVKKPVQQ